MTPTLFTAQWISLLYRRLQKIEQIEPDHCDRYQNNRTKNAIEWHWSPTSEMVGILLTQISLKCRKSLNLIKLLKSLQFIIT